MKVGVLMGGISSEREISLMSGKEIVENLDIDKYDVVPIVIDSKIDIFEKAKDIDFAFIALHGAFGEDGTVQSILETMKIPYSGSDVLTSAICMSKKQAKRIMKNQGINVAQDINLKNKNFSIFNIEKLRYPMVVKPNSGGSSVGTYIVKDRTELISAIDEAFKYDKEVLVEQYLQGEEYTIPILNGKIMPILQIKTKETFFDYKAKYFDDKTQEVVVKLPKELEEQMESIAINCWDIFDCKSYVRVDIIVSDGIAYVLELNTAPGMTKTSLFPRSAKAANMEYSELLDKIIEYSLI
ncbi:D-alanine--D-alanine ligase [Clostridium sp. YIM B02505]|uniref:D-alanine--D-alanine ligase n=1 Tax=Clostridium yunnanense TaxID=2800325 RepID=A0ABS1EMN5_9CLOT|nr:D-alanine--D-alanine ligase [Clostridium yunnanense]MBK1810588.1 D-alanine--D-alanine ligase [Clostridium yunnanense]